jgi:hypothetical protein
MCTSRLFQNPRRRVLIVRRRTARQRVRGRFESEPRSSSLVCNLVERVQNSSSTLAATRTVTFDKDFCHFARIRRTPPGRQAELKIGQALDFSAIDAQEVGMLYDARVLVAKQLESAQGVTQIESCQQSVIGQLNQTAINRRLVETKFRQSFGDFRVREWKPFPRQTLNDGNAGRGTAHFRHAENGLGIGGRELR